MSKLQTAIVNLWSVSLMRPGRHNDNRVSFCARALLRRTADTPDTHELPSQISILGQCIFNRQFRERIQVIQVLSIYNKIQPRIVA